MPTKSQHLADCDQWHKLPNWLIDSERYLDLSPYAKALHTRLLRQHNGHNNGRIFLSVRDAAEQIRAAIGTAAKAFHELVEAGFIENVREGLIGPRSGRAAEYWLTHLPCDVTGQLPKLESPTVIAERSKREAAKFNGVTAPKGKRPPPMMDDVRNEMRERLAQEEAANDIPY
jgi:hypothetical protein